MGRLPSLIAALLLLGAVGFATLTLGARAFSPADQDSSYVYPVQITSVAVRTLDDGSGQLALDIEGVIGNGCSRFEQVVQWREENRIMVEVLARHSGAEICTMIAQIYRDTVVLDGPLAPGDYEVNVNGATQGLHIE